MKFREEKNVINYLSNIFKTFFESNNHCTTVHVPQKNIGSGQKRSIPVPQRCRKKNFFKDLQNTLV